MFCYYAEWRIFYYYAECRSAIYLCMSSKGVVAGIFSHHGLSGKAD
jgi:hypothetical protein